MEAYWVWVAEYVAYAEAPEPVTGRAVVEARTAAEAAHVGRTLWPALCREEYMVVLAAPFTATKG